MRIRRIQWATGLALVGVAVTGCAGPSAPLDVGTQNAPLALVLGELKAADNAPVGSISGSPNPPGRPYYQPPVGVPVPPVSLPPMPQLPCPDFPPLSPVLGVGRSITAPPVKASYRYRALVVESYAGKPGPGTPFSGDSVWSVAPQVPDASTGAYDVIYTIKFGKVVTTRVLRVLPHDLGSDGEPSDQSNPNGTVAQANGILSTFSGAPTLPTNLPNPAGYGLAGIYFVSQKSTVDGTPGAAFEPSTPIALLQLRQLSGATDKAGQEASAITSVGVDPVHQAVMAFRSTVTNPTNKVNACGTKLETVQVSLTSPLPPGTAPTTPVPLLDLGAAFYAEKAPGANKANMMLFGEKLDFGLQFGGLMVQDEAGVLPTGLIPNGIQVDPLDPPTATPSGSPDPSDPVATATWAGTPILIWALQHMILKQTSFTINEKPKLPKSP